MCLVGNKRAEIARVVPCENNFCTKYAHHLHFCGLQKLNTLNLRHFHLPLNTCNHFSTVLIKTNWYTISCKYNLCTGLTTITIPNSVKTIDNYAFSGCNNLKSITLSDSTITIGYYAFDKCAGISTIKIPASVTSIGKGAFNDCNGLREIFTKYKDPITLPKEVFNAQIYNNAILHIPEGCNKYYQIRAYWKNFATIWDDNGKPGSSGDTYTEGDINHDGTVDMDDVSALINQILSK